MNNVVPKKRGLIVFGAYGGVNLGDEIILRAICAKARTEGYDNAIKVVVGQQPETKGLQADYMARGLSPVSYRSPIGLLKAAFRRDLFIGGGQIIDGVAGVQLPLLQTLVALACRVSGGRVSIIGASTARLNKRSIRLVYRLLFAISDRIEMRDMGSAQEVMEIIPSAKQRISATADLVFGIRNEIASSVDLNERRLILFSIHHAPKLQLTSVKESAKFLQALKKTVSNDFQIAIIIHDVRPDFDQGFAHKIADLAQIPDLKILSPSTTDELIAYYQNARTIVSVRMHPIIIGACAGAVCVPISGSRKQQDLANRMDLTCISLKELSEMSEAALRETLGLGISPRPVSNKLLSILEQAASNSQDRIEGGV